MDPLTKKTLPKAAMGKNCAAPGDERRQNSTEDVVVDNNRASSINAETVSIREETSEKKKSEGISCTKENSILDPIPNNVDQDGDNDDDLMDIRVPSGMILLEDSDDSKRPTTTIPQKPAEHLKVDNRAIVDCWKITVTSHDVATTIIAPDSVTMATTTGVSPSQLPSTLNYENGFCWHAKDLVTPSSTAEESNSDVLKNWQPKALALPTWAVDPFEMGFIIDRTKTNTEDTKHHQKRIKR
jgi:hypothetical protein